MFLSYKIFLKITNKNSYSTHLPVPLVGDGQNLAIHPPITLKETNFPFSMYIFLDDVVGCGEEPNATKFDEKRILFLFLYLLTAKIYVCEFSGGKSKRNKEY